MSNKKITSKLIRIKEFDYLFCEGANKLLAEANVISKKAFDELTQLIHDAPEQDGNDHSTIFWQRGKKLQARSYVGIVQTSDGTQIEILPKIANSYSREELQHIFLKMLRVVGEVPFKSGQFASLNTDKLPLLEIFIHDFLITVDELVKRGIRSDYLRQEDNLPFLKGKLKIAQQIKHNSIRQDRFYVEFDNFDINRPENRLIKSSLEKIVKMAKKVNNQRLARELLFAFDEVDASANYKNDFSKCSKDRGMVYYASTLAWCKLILGDESPVPKIGERSFRSFLFPMSTLFERYVAKILRRKLPEWHLLTQVSSKKLLSSDAWGKDLFVIKPDILLRKNSEILVADTKWKLLNNDQTNKFNINQSDIYQLFTYAKYYESKKVILIYPKTDDFSLSIKTDYIDQDIKLIFMPFDLQKNEFDITLF
jgi:5-methylcytosine-specific restriction enzyme subunit McrC